MSFIGILLGAAIIINGQSFVGVLIIAISIGISPDVREYAREGFKVINSRALPALFGPTNVQENRNTQNPNKSLGSVQAGNIGTLNQKFYPQKEESNNLQKEESNNLQKEESNKIDLELYFDESKTYHTRTIGDSTLKGVFLHVVVKNKNKKETAKNCRGELIMLTVVTNDREHPHPNFTGNLILHWANMTDPHTGKILYDSKDILPGDSVNLDVCHSIENTELFYIFAPHVHDGIQKDFPLGSYHVKIRVYGDNTNPITNDFLIHFSGDWKDISMEPYLSKK
ncbi:MAG: hypothetical protein L6243_06780 [Candidatus Altiarchaeales archaeon]|nr:hypothetical protein [Candidatus Altiarchaeota archaeon]MCG2783277.1 hypothetical protein [Candidatus Altiarchaeales archaeon]